MAEAFSNSITRTVGVVTSYSGSTIGAAATSITVTANTGIGVSDMVINQNFPCLLYTSPSPRDGLLSRMPSSA